MYSGMENQAQGDEGPAWRGRERAALISFLEGFSPAGSRCGVGNQRPVQEQEAACKHWGRSVCIHIS